MSKYIDAENLRAFLQKKLESYKSKMVDPSKFPIDHIDLMALLASEYQALIIQIDSLQQEPIEKDEETEKLIVCDIIEATIARINGGKKDKEKEENIMREKIAYLRDLGLKVK